MSREALFRSTRIPPELGAQKRGKKEGTNVLKLFVRVSVSFALHLCIPSSISRGESVRRKPVPQFTARRSRFCTRKLFGAVGFLFLGCSRCRIVVHQRSFGSRRRAVSRTANAAVSTTIILVASGVTTRVAHAAVHMLLDSIHVEITRAVETLRRREARSFWGRLTIGWRARSWRVVLVFLLRVDFVGGEKISVDVMARLPYQRLLRAILPVLIRYCTGTNPSHWI